ncbi:hypothetical protein Zmor_003764 [Zophobas morio]|uniref:PiggyBac transposable element-derived protein domain-containing protein n=1 Tax=Zophobas morio TaxID=2755281 RepID=A0AA38HMI5_9CUCU|nr:hypothetical protein Zmor_003764 [Zophobas morio]
MPKGLTDEQLMVYLYKDDDSVVFELSDEEDEDTPDQRATTDFLDNVNLEEREPEENEQPESGDEIEHVTAEQEIELAEKVEDATAEREEMKDRLKAFYEEFGITEKEKMTWTRDINYQTRPVKWHVPPLEEVDDLSAPIKFFERYITNAIFLQMAEMTNLYATQKNIARFPPTSVEEMKKFIGIHIIMGNLNLPRARLYWNASLGIPIVQDAMSFNRFSKLRNLIHLVDITAREPNNQDRLWKVRDLYDSIRKRCRELPLETHLCVDESK